MDPQKATPNGGQFDQVVERLHSANNVLVTVPKNPTIDQLAACIGMTLVLNKLGKHASAVFSGEVPSTIDFLQPEKTIEKNTDSLRDFIIALDKSKADKLRYKVEDQVVKIFITPYKTSISEKDLDFSQGDFNVDGVVALGVHDRVQLDQVILNHGRILHDATVMSVNTKGGSQLGSIAWVDANSSSLCEMVSDISQQLSQNVFDGQISTALLTGIVAETDRFSNQKASPHTMSVAGVLMAGGASAQLVTSKLEEAAHKQQAPPTPVQPRQEEAPNNGGDGILEIDHTADKENIPEKEKPSPQSMPPVAPINNDLDVPGAVFEEFEQSQGDETPNPEDEGPYGQLMNEPPSMGGQLTANSVPEYKRYEDTTDPLSHADEKKGKILNRPGKKNIHKKTLSQIEESVESPHIQKRTLSEIEESVNSPHLHQGEVGEAPQLDNARDVVNDASPPQYDQKDQSVGSRPVDLDLGHGTEESNGASTSSPPPSSPPPPVPPPYTPSP